LVVGREFRVNGDVRLDDFFGEGSGHGYWGCGC
jgi:hypothetical protein